MASNRYTQLSESQVRALQGLPVDELLSQARDLTLQGHRNLVTYSRKVFAPLTQLCRDVCHYCTFAKTPGRLDNPYLSIEQALDIARQGSASGCREILFTLGDQPELRYSAARNRLQELGHSSTLSYLEQVAGLVYEETGLFPHLNPGLMSREAMARLREVSVSMGLMLESTSTRLCEKGGPHWGSPDKNPAKRLETLKIAGELNIPFTTGILIGIGETRQERIESLLAIRELHRRYGHIQEVIIQNFRAKPGTLMANAEEPSLDEHLWTIAMARHLFGPDMNLQAPPNLQPGVLARLLDAGINDWGGVSPVTPDHVNPEAPWPHLLQLEQETRNAGYQLTQRFAIGKQYFTDLPQWVDRRFQRVLLTAADGCGLPRENPWRTGEPGELPAQAKDWTGGRRIHTPTSLTGQLLRKIRRTDLDETSIARLFAARGDDVASILRAADELRRDTLGDEVTFVVNRNINYTNICSYHCHFCAFSKGKVGVSEESRDRPYNLDLDTIAGRTMDAWDRGATEVCMQGGIHPQYTGQTYLDICRTVKQACPDMHIHAFSPLEVYQGAATLGISVEEFLTALKNEGLNSLPGTAAEILDDEVRAILCPDKLNTQQWLATIEAAHEVGIKTTSTIMFGHVDTPTHWARHLLAVKALQQRTGGITEFVPLPFVAAEAPLFRRGQARAGPTLRESLLMHGVARLVLHRHIPNIQASWVKLGPAGVAACLNAGVNDLGGTLMDESISRAAGASHGQEMGPEKMEYLIQAAGRSPRQRTTFYGEVPVERLRAARNLIAVSGACVVAT